MTFIDNKGRSICLEEESEDTIRAYNEGKDVGYIRFIVSKYPDGNGNLISIAYPEQMHICKDFQRSGIATNIIMFAKEVYDEVQFLDGNPSGNSDEIHYTAVGSAFKSFCEKNEITKVTGK